MTSASKEIYTSSNGDRWELMIDGNGDPVVHHTPTVSSGGSSTHVEIGNFLTRDRGSPQHQELLRMIATLVEA